MLRYIIAVLLLLICVFAWGDARHRGRAVDSSGEVYQADKWMDYSLWTDCVLWVPVETNGLSLGADYSQYNTHGTAEGDIKGTNVNGRWCLTLDGTGDYIDFGDPPILDAWRGLTFTITFIFRTATGAGTPVSKADHTSYQGFWTYIDGSGKLLFQLWDNAGNYIDVRTDASFHDGNWHHAACTYDGSVSANGMTIYVDGVDVAQTIGKNDTLGTVANDYSWNIGSVNDGNFEFTGELDDIRLFSIELTSTEVLELYQETTL